MRRHRKRRAVQAVPPALSHLRRETRTALELAIVALGPMELVEKLAAAAGLLEAIVELPSDSPPVIALTDKLAKRATSALEEWRKWQSDHLALAKA